ncbi:carboxymuconolactone decarboxylase family protein [Nonomuraea sp. NPDC049400]|uniref:carboxymuconolactone decarboxylase family protein n=1 Tax=Nonomuraea sp. NPDC049400 TaxID=3364352 RepID=UPI0037890FAB
MLATTQELVALRVSQINGCSVYVDMRTKEAAHAGESSVRLNLVAAWREAKVLPRRSGPPWNWANRAPASPTPPVVSAMRPGRTPPSTLTRMSSPSWWASSPS